MAGSIRRSLGRNIGAGGCLGALQDRDSFSDLLNLKTWKVFLSEIIEKTHLGIRQMQIFFSTCEFFVPSDAENPPISSRSRSSVANPSVDFHWHL